MSAPFRLILVSYLGCFSQSLIGLDSFNQTIAPLFEQNCVKCHGGEKTKGKVNLMEIRSQADILAKPELIKELIEVIDFGDMPPENEQPLSEEQRTATILLLKDFMRQAAADAKRKKPRLSRLNRFQYNNSLRDLFRIESDLFELSEKMMTRRTKYLQTSAETIPQVVRASAYHRDKGFREVRPFPKDLRAAHGFDNQSDQLTLSPLLMDTFLKLSVSIVESPDFNERTVGIWKEFFAPPANSENLEGEIRDRLKPFLRLAFRSAVEKEVADRYVRYAQAQVKSEESFTAGMKKVVSAILSSPLFVFRHETVADNDPYALASKLSFSLWGSCPDEGLLNAAEKGSLTNPNELAKVVDGMLEDPKIERFLDSFPSQWMQLENALAPLRIPRSTGIFPSTRNIRPVWPWWSNRFCFSMPFSLKTGRLPS